MQPTALGRVATAREYSASTLLACSRLQRNVRRCWCIVCLGFQLPLGSRRSGSRGFHPISVPLNTESVKRKCTGAALMYAYSMQLFSQYSLWRIIHPPSLVVILRRRTESIGYSSTYVRTYVNQNSEPTFTFDSIWLPPVRAKRCIRNRFIINRNDLPSCLAVLCNALKCASASSDSCVYALH